MLSKGIYSIPCPCEAVYNGETGRSVKTRLSEHEPLAKIIFEDTSVIVNYPPYILRKFIEIMEHSNNFNCDIGYPLPSVQNTVLIPQACLLQH